MKKFKTAVIGCGAVSKNHGKALMSSEYAHLEYAVDCDFQKAMEFATTFGGQPLSDYKELFRKDDVDVVHIATPHHTHPRIAMDCLNAGLHVFCEKPLAILPHDAKAMIACAQENGRRLGVCFQNRMNESVIEAKKILDEGVFGSIVSGMVVVTWERSGTYYSESPWRGMYETEGGGVLINQSIHSLDLLNYLSGGIHSIAGIATKLRDDDAYEVEDTAMFHGSFINGGTFVGFCTNCYPKSKQCLVELHLEHATLVITQHSLSITHNQETTVHAFDKASGYKSEWGLSHGVLIDEFYRSLKEDRPFMCDGSNGLAAIKIVQAIQHSNGRIMRIME